MTILQRAGRVAYRLAWPALFVYLRVGGRTRVLVLSQQHILLVQGWLDDGRWGLPGGGLHRHEEPVMGAVREVQEETGVILRPEVCKAIGSEWRQRQGLKSFVHFFVANIDTLQPTQKQRGEIIAVQWLPLASIKDLPHKAEVDRALELLASVR